MEFFPSLISRFLICSIVLIASFTFASADELILQGTVGEKPLVRYSFVGRELKLICNLNAAEVTSSTKPQWSFMGHNGISVRDVNSSCEGKPSSTTKNDNSSRVLSDCKVTFDKKNAQLSLKWKNINSDEFGNYTCHTGNMSMPLASTTFSLKELVHLFRKNEKGKIEKSVTVTMGERLHLYCEETGLQPQIHKISWLRDGEDITDKLRNHQSPFETFKKDSDLSYHGIALLEHRGNYTCQVNLISEPDDNAAVRDYYPVQFSFFVRIKDGNEWKLPVYILVGECVVIGLFTLLISWREKRLEDKDEVTIDDSEDEDEDPKSNSKNGTQNNNSNGK